MPSLAVVAADLRQQWELLREWLEHLPDPASPGPSTLPGWSLADLVAHLGRVLASISALESVPQSLDDDPLTLSEYLASYAGADPAWIDERTREMTAAIADDPLARLDELAEKAFADLDLLLVGAGPDTTVRAGRGLITLYDFTVSRLIELVVHGYDLAPTLPLPAPVDPTARTIVAEALLDVARHRTGTQIDVGNETAWIKVAAGRTDWAAAVAAGAVRPSAISDGTPDLAPALPLL